MSYRSFHYAFITCKGQVSCCLIIAALVAPHPFLRLDRLAFLSNVVQGFPRANIDIPAIRSDRVQVIRLTNDHKQLTQELEQILHQFHARAGHVAERHSTAAPPAAARPAGEDTAQQPRANGAHALDMRPFALIDEVFEDSPAREAGVQLGDQVVEFAGSINAQTASPLSAVATALQRNIGKAVKMVVLRDGVPAVLQLTPQSWGGRGLLGCHLKPM